MLVANLKATVMEKMGNPTGIMANMRTFHKLPNGGGNKWHPYTYQS